MASSLLPPSLLFTLTITLTLTSLLLIPTTPQTFISLQITQKGLNFTKNLLINKAITSLIPLSLPQLDKKTKIPLLGDVYLSLEGVCIDKVDVEVEESVVKSGSDGVTLVVEGGKAEMSMEWRYKYDNWFFEVEDRGVANVQVEGMEVGLTIGLENIEGSLKLNVLECGCYVKAISISLEGGASWLYQGLVDAFEEQIKSAVETGISNQITEAVRQFDSSLESLPKEVVVDDTAALNVTITSNPILSDSSVEVQINGLFTSVERVIVPSYHHSIEQPSYLCNGLEKMLGISLNEHVFNSGAMVYYNAGILQWIVDKVPDQHFLNTRSWKYIIPQLYKKYPNYDMDFNISLSSPPVISLSYPHNIDATIYSDVTIDVLDSHETTPVACLSLVISASGSLEIIGNNLAGSLKLDSFTVFLKWSKIGSFHMALIQSMMRTLIKTVALPYANLRLKEGFPLPIIHGFTLQNVFVYYSFEKILICSDMDYKE